MGIGNSIHAGQVIVADGTEEAGRRLERTLTADPGLGVVRHADAGYDEARIFGGHDVTFECRCSRERVANVLRALGVDEVRSVIAEQGACTVTCEFCQKPYKFDAIDAEQLFAEAPPRGSDSIN